MTRPTPDRDSAAWWDALADHQLLVQTCDQCGTHRLVPRALCSSCGAFSWHWTRASGEGTVASWTVSHRTYQPGRTAPYVALFVRLAEGTGLLLPGGWAGRPDGSDLSVGLPVSVTFEDLSEDPPATLLRWARRTAGQPNT